MRTIDNMQLRRMGRKYMMVRVLQGNVNLTEVYTLNATAALLWQWAEGRDFSAQEMAEVLCQKYYVEPAQALQDVELLLSEWRSFHLLTD